MPNISPWPDFETWKNDGLSREYNKINPASLQRSDNKIEKSWYKRGRRKGWNSNFIYESRLRIIPIEFKNKSQWKEYGIERGYNQKNSTALKKSNDPLEKYWHYKGSENKWLSYFPFLKKEDVIIRDVNIIKRGPSKYVSSVTSTVARSPGGFTLDDLGTATIWLRKITKTK